MKFFLKQYCAIISCLIATNTAVAQGFDIEGTDYYEAKSTTQIWLEDASNLYIEMAKSFACVISDARPEITANGLWSGIFSETKCQLADDGGSESLATAVIESSRASNELPQEVSMWFSTGNGNKFVVAVRLHESAEDFAPYGRWGFAYYLYSSPEIPGMTFTADTSPTTGYVLISQDVDPTNAGGVVIEGYDTYNEEGDYERVAGKFIFSADLNSTRFIGRDTVQAYQNYDVGHAGQTNESHYFQLTVEYDDDGTIEAGSEEEACFSRDSTWKNGHRQTLFDYSTGEKISFTGAFNFKDQQLNRGYYGTWGIWFSDDDMRPDPSDPILKITDDSGSEFDLVWTPGDLITRDAGTSVLKTSEFLNAVGGTLLTCDSDCFTSASAPYSVQTIDTESGIPSDGENEQYILTNVSHEEPLTLFHDANGNGVIDDGEKPIRYDFSVNWDPEEEAEYHSSYSSDDSGEVQSPLHVWNSMSLKNSDGAEFQWQPKAYEWDHIILAMKEDGSIYEMTPELVLEKDYNFAADDVNGGRARQSDDEDDDFWILSFDSYSDEPGTGAGDCLAITDDEGPNGFICEIDLDGLKYNTSGNPENTNTRFSYDGQSLRSRYYNGVDTKLGWISVLNPKNGTVLSDVNDPDQKYVVVQTELEEYLDRLDEGDEAACDDIKFSSLSELGLSLSDIPKDGDYPLPQFSWSDQPEETGSCEVVIGELGEGC
jgi:hypothetical protein